MFNKLRYIIGIIDALGIKEGDTLEVGLTDHSILVKKSELT